MRTVTVEVRLNNDGTHVVKEVAPRIGVKA
jgi:hypothetical protein